MNNMVKDTSAVIRPITGAGKCCVSVVELLHWAFQRECAQLDFDELRTVAGSVQIGVDTVYRLMELRRLGCRVDGGGRSDPHPDADVVASAVAALPEGHGGRGMAIRLVELARVGCSPDWMPDATPRFHPVDVHINRHGVNAKKDDAAKLGGAGWPAQPRRNRKGVIVRDVVEFCPVVCRPSVSDIAQARRGYLQWWAALLDLRDTFRVYGGLSAFKLNSEMPSMRPWANCA